MYSHAINIKMVRNTFKVVEISNSWVKDMTKFLVNWQLYIVIASKHCRQPHFISRVTLRKAWQMIGLREFMRSMRDRRRTDSMRFMWFLLFGSSCSDEPNVRYVTSSRGLREVVVFIVFGSGVGVGRTGGSSMFLDHGVGHKIVQHPKTWFPSSK